MAKVQIKFEKVTPFGGIFHVRELFSRFIGPVIDKVLGFDAHHSAINMVRLWGLCQAFVPVVATAWGT